MQHQIFDLIVNSIIFTKTKSGAKNRVRKVLFAVAVVVVVVQLLLLLFLLFLLLLLLLWMLLLLLFLLLSLLLQLLLLCKTPNMKWKIQQYWICKVKVLLEIFGESVANPEKIRENARCTPILDNSPLSLANLREWKREKNSIEYSIA